MLVEAKANIQARNNETGWVPLHECANNGNLPVLKYLLELGAPHMPRTSSGLFPIDMADQSRHNNIADYLSRLYKI